LRRRKAPRRRDAYQPRLPALGQPAYISLARESKIGQLEPSAAIDEDLVRAVDQHVGYPWLAEQRLQWTSADTMPPQRLHGVEYS
jgi:hypothetical protein